MKISVFQALTLLAKAYREDKDKFPLIKRLYLSGVKNDKDRALLTHLLKDPCLEGYDVSAEPEVINQDSSRRYFESQLAYESLHSVLDGLDSGLLCDYFDSLQSFLPKKRQQLYERTLFSGTLEGIRGQRGANREFGEWIYLLSGEKNFTHLKPTSIKDEAIALKVWGDRKEKMKWLSKCAFMGLAIIRRHPFPLNIYSKEGYVFSREERGRIDRENFKEGTLRSFNLGLMRSYMPVPQVSEIKSTQPSGYLRPVDMRTYRKDKPMGVSQQHYVPDMVFSTLVSPYVNSISGTLFIQLRAMAGLLKEKRLVYFTESGDAKYQKEQLKNFFKAMIANMLYSAGGHSFQEFMMLFDLPEVKEAFKDVPGFDEINLETLFKEENDRAFMAALDKTLSYNDKVITTGLLAKEILSPKSPFPDKGQDFLTLLARSRLHKVPTSQEVNQAYFDFIEAEYPLGMSLQKVVNNHKFLLRSLKIKHSSLKDVAQLRDLINEAMKKRADALREKLFKPGRILAERLDEAWLVYCDSLSTEFEREHALDFLLFGLNIDLDALLSKDEPERNGELINKVLFERMTQRALYKEINPEFVPGLSPLNIDERLKPHIKKTKAYQQAEHPLIKELMEKRVILDVNERSRLKDRGEMRAPNTQKRYPRTTFFNPTERDLFRVYLHGKSFKEASGNLVDTSQSVAHGRKGWAAFTVNVHGEVSLFQHRHIEIMHSSPNAAKPVVFAGEIKIEKGKLIAINDYSGHYRPNPFNLYKTLCYFESQGVDVSKAQVFIHLSNAKRYENLKGKASQKHKEFRVFEPQAPILQYRQSILRQAIKDTQKSLESYRTIGFWTILYFIKDWLTGSKLTSNRLAIAERTIGELNRLNKEIDTISTLDQAKAMSQSLIDLSVGSEKENELLSKEHHKAANSGRLAGKLGTFRKSRQLRSACRETGYFSKES